jgi:hypothetical protein
MKKEMQVSSSSLFSKIKLILAALLIFLLGSGMENTDSRRAHDTRLAWMVNHVTLQSGDLVFRRGKSLVSEAVLLADRNSSYSHVGMVLDVNGRKYVIHSVPEETKGSGNKIKFERLASFLSYENASHAAVFHLAGISRSALRNSISWACQACIKQIPFDNEYRLETDNSLYCTELVWKSYRYGGIDLTAGQPDELGLPFMKGRIILPGTLLQNSNLTKRYSF